MLDGAEERGEAGDDEAGDGRLDVPLGVDDPLGWDDGLRRLEDPVESLDGPCEDCESLDALSDEPEGLASEDFDGEPLERDDASLFDDRLSEDGDDVSDEPLLCDFDDGEEERADGVEIELFDSDDLLSDEVDELRRELLSELLRPELLGERFDELPDDSLELGRLLEDLSDDADPLEPELRRLLLALLFDELSSELERLLSDESLDELGDDREDSLTLENDLLDP